MAAIKILNLLNFELGKMENLRIRPSRIRNSCGDFWE